MGPATGGDQGGGREGLELYGSQRIDEGMGHVKGTLRIEDELTC